MLWLYNDDNEQPFIKAISLQFNPAVIDRSPLFEGQICDNCFRVSLAMFDTQSAELLANAEFWVNPFNHQRLINDLQEKLFITLALMLLFLSGFWILFKRLLQQLINTQQHNQTILDSLQDSLFIVNTAGQILDQSPIFNSSSKIQNNTIGDFIEPLQNQPIKHIFTSKLNHPIEVRFKQGKHKGDIGLMTISKVQQIGTYKNDRFIVLIENIQALRSAQAELKHQTELAHLSRLRTLGEMASGIAHEVKQPLAVIRLAAESLQHLHQQDSLLEDRQFAHELDQTIIDQVDRADRIIRNIRSFARLEQAPAQWVKIPDVIESAVGFVKQAYRLNRIKLIETLDYSAPLLFIEYHKLEQVLVNLIANAKDAIEEKIAKQPTHDYQPWIKIDLYIEANQLVLSIADNGIGMTKEQQSQCLTPFYTTKAESEGVGIGLAIVKNIVDLYDAELAITSEVGNGSCFILRFNCPANPLTDDAHAW